MRFVAGLALAVLLGAATSVAVVAAHPRPVGLLLGLAATAAALTALPAGRWRCGYALGWVAVVAVVIPTRPEGDWVIESDVTGYLLLLATLVVVVWGLATLPVSGREHRGRGVAETGIRPPVS